MLLEMGFDPFEVAAMIRWTEVWRSDHRMVAMFDAHGCYCVWRLVVGIARCCQKRLSQKWCRFLCKESVDGKVCWNKRVVDGHALDEEGKKFSLARDVGKGAPVNVNWERLHVLDCISAGQSLHAERFSVLQVKGCYCTTTKRLTRMIAQRGV